MKQLFSGRVRVRRDNWRLMILGASLVTGFTMAPSDPAHAIDAWGSLPGFDTHTKQPLSTNERRARSRQKRDALAATMESEFQPLPALVSQESINGLSRAVQRYQSIVDQGGWPKVPERTLRPGDGGEAIRALRRRLWLSGDLKERTRSDWQYDRHLERAVARFQKRHGMRLTGFVDRRTRRALNIPAAARLHQLRINLQRLQDLVKINEAERYVLVNVPSFKLYAVEENGQRIALESGVIAGKPSRATPVISAKIKELNFYPYWRVPDSIAHKDLIPAIRKNPAYFREQHFSLLKTWGAEPMDPATIDWNSPDVYKYKFRQDPGPWNALGLVRINMPNKEIVYLHDTPLKDLFQQSSRAFSSGCVRVERVMDVANWLLQRHDEWTPTLVDSAVQDGVQRSYKLKKPVPVHFVYVTSWASENGTPYFRHDLYGHDGGSFMVADNKNEIELDSDEPKKDTLRRVFAISP